MLIGHLPKFNSTYTQLSTGNFCGSFLLPIPEIIKHRKYRDMMILTFLFKNSCLRANSGYITVEMKPHVCFC